MGCSQGHTKVSSGPGKVQGELRGVGCPGLEAGPPRCWDTQPILPEPWFWVCKMGQEGGFLVNSNQVTRTLEVVTAGHLTPGRAFSTPETRTSGELLSSVEITHILKETTPKSGRFGSPNTKTSPYPTDCPAAEICRCRCTRRHGPPPTAPPPGDQACRSRRARAPASSQWAWRTRHREQRRPPSRGYNGPQASGHCGRGRWARS